MDVEIDYTEKIRLFQNMSDNYNEETALEYLEINDWNERKAVESYLKSNKKLNQSNRQTIRDSNESQSNRQNQLSQVNKGEGGLFSKVSSFLYSLLCNKRNDSDKENDINFNEIFELYPFKSKVYNDFLEKTKSKLGIIIIYKNEDVRVLNNIQSSIEINENHYIIDILNNNYVMYVTSNSSIEGQSIINEYKFNSNKTNISIVSLNKFNKFSIIDSHKGTLNFESFQNMIISNLERKKEEKNDTNSFDYIDENQHLSQAALINKQKVELERLEKDEENKKRKAKQEEELKKKERIEEEERKKKANQQKITSISLLPHEPSADDGNSTLIIFRYPHSEERRQRRFLKSERIELLYIYVRSLGSDIFEESNEFEIITPFPMRIYKDMSKTLEDEHLYPNAVVQIREI